MGCGHTTPPPLVYWRRCVTRGRGDGGGGGYGARRGGERREPPGNPMTPDLSPPAGPARRRRPERGEAAGPPPNPTGSPKSSGTGFGLARRLLGFELRDLTRWHRFVRLLHRPQDPAALGAFRAAFGQRGRDGAGGIGAGKGPGEPEVLGEDRESGG